MSQTNSENRSKTSTLLPQSGPEILLGVAIIIPLLAAAYLIVSDYREKSALPEIDAYKEQKNSEHNLTIMCIDGYRYLTNDAAMQYAVQMWENGPEGTRHYQCTREIKWKEADANPGELLFIALPKDLARSLIPRAFRQNERAPPIARG